MYFYLQKMGICFIETISGGVSRKIVGLKRLLIRDIVNNIVRRRIFLLFSGLYNFQLKKATMRLL